MHMSQKQIRPGTVQRMPTAGESSANKFLVKRQGTIASKNEACRNGEGKTDDSALASDWLNQKSKRGPTHITGGRVGFSLSQFTKKRNTNANAATATATNRGRPTKLINTAGADFDGSVCIPKPSKLLFQQSSSGTPTDAVPATRKVVTPTTIDSKSRETILNQQAELAQRIKRGGITTTTITKSSEKSETGSNGPRQHAYNALNSRTLSRYSSAPRSRQQQQKQQQRNSGNQRTGGGEPTTSNDEEVDAFLLAMGGGRMDEETVRNAKSRFASEVEADEYANRRRKLVELEKMEASRQSRQKKKKTDSGGMGGDNNSNNRMMTKTWFCKNCQQHYTVKPRSCIAAQHAVKTIRKLKEVSTKDERRNALHRKRIEDGGLVLGSGIDWKIHGNRVGYNRFNN